jgi:class 3 adenylate cyclase
VCSVLFCDVVGFTPLSECRDPEAVRELLSRYFPVARTVIGRYGGVVEKFIGDAVMAVWGTPAATEGMRSGRSAPGSIWLRRSPIWVWGEGYRGCRRGRAW